MLPATRANSSFRVAETDDPWNIRYGTGETEGMLATDTVTVAGLTVHNQTFALANETSSIFASSGSDGIMGMGFDSIAASGQPTWFENLVRSKSVSRLFPVFVDRADLLCSWHPMFSHSICSERTILQSSPVGLLEAER